MCSEFRREAERFGSARTGLALFLIPLAEGRGDRFVVSGHGGKRLVRHPTLKFLAMCESDDGIAALDVVIKEVKRLSGDVGLKPEGDLAQFDGERIEVYAIDAFANDVANGGAEGGRGWLFFAGTDYGKLRGYAAGGGKEDMARAASYVGDTERRAEPSLYPTP